MPESPFDQQRYQVRHDWGVEGLRRLAPADVVVVVDVLRFSTTVTDAVARGETPPLDVSAHALSLNGAAVAAAAETGATVLLGCLRDARAVADAVLDIQRRRAERTSIAVIAAGELAGRQSGAPLRFAVEDQLGAGAVIDALGAVGIDHTSPEAAAACEAFRGLRGAVRHLLTASASGQELLGRTDRPQAASRDEVLYAAAVDAASVVPVLREGRFVAY
jgi:2-phosphosulfolactate phosphatase